MNGTGTDKIRLIPALDAAGSHVHRVADSAITFTLRFWIPYQKQGDYVGAKSAAIMRIKRAFVQADTVIPFSSRPLDVPPALLQQLRLPRPTKGAGPARDNLPMGSAVPERA